MKFNKEKYKVLNLGKNSPMHRAGDHPGKSSLTEKDLWFLVDTELNNMPLQQRKLTVFWAASGKVLPKG